MNEANGKRDQKTILGNFDYIYKRCKLDVKPLHSTDDPIVLPYAMAIQSDLNGKKIPFDI